MAAGMVPSGSSRWPSRYEGSTAPQLTGPQRRPSHRERERAAPLAEPTPQRQNQSAAVEARGSASGFPP